MVIHMTLKSIVIGTALLTTGVLAGNRVKHAAASVFADEPLPYAAISYKGNGTYVNGEKMFGELTDAEREQYITETIAEDRSMLHDYIRSATPDEKRHIAVYSLLQLSRDAGTSIAQQVDSMASSLGYRWKAQLR
jgi:hypothetical protein